MARTHTSLQAPQIFIFLQIVPATERKLNISMYQPTKRDSKYLHLLCTAKITVSCTVRAESFPLYSLFKASCDYEN